MLKVIRNPKGQLIRFEYDALGRRTAKIVNTKIYRYLWEGNVLLHQWSYELGERPKIVSDYLGLLILDKPEPIHNVTTWLYEDGSLVPTAKISDDNTYFILSDYFESPAQAYDKEGKFVCR